MHRRRCHPSPAYRKVGSLSAIICPLSRRADRWISSLLRFDSLIEFVIEIQDSEEERCNRSDPVGTVRAFHAILVQAVPEAEFAYQCHDHVNPLRDCQERLYAHPVGVYPINKAYSRTHHEQHKESDRQSDRNRVISGHCVQYFRARVQPIRYVDTERHYGKQEYPPRAEARELGAASWYWIGDDYTRWRIGIDVESVGHGGLRIPVAARLYG